MSLLPIVTVNDHNAAHSQAAQLYQSKAYTLQGRVVNALNISNFDKSSMQWLRCSIKWLGLFAALYEDRTLIYGVDRKVQVPQIDTNIIFLLNPGRLLYAFGLCRAKSRQIRLGFSFRCCRTQYI